MFRFIDLFLVEFITLFYALFVAVRPLRRGESTLPIFSSSVEESESSAALKVKGDADLFVRIH